MIASNVRLAVAAAIVFTGLAAVLAPLVWQAHAQETGRPAKAEGDEKRWLAVAPGRVEPASGEIKIVAPVIGVIEQVLVRANDKVFAGEAMVRLDDAEAQARLTSAEAQVALRRRARNDEGSPARAAARRRAEDAAANGEKAAVDARSALDRVAIDRRAGRASDADLEAARSVLTRAQDRLKQLKADLQKIEADAPLPTSIEGQLNIARADWLAAVVALDKMTIRAPIAGTILQITAKAGELATPSAPQPLILLGDISGLRVRAELDERDYGEVKVGQSAVVRPPRFAGARSPARSRSSRPWSSRAAAGCAARAA
jgi:HlyD family secretion protein